MSPSGVHVVGAGLAGLSAAVRCAAAGLPVTLWEAAGHAGGRCRSFDEPALGRRIDNGNHLVLSGNRAVLEYLALIGAGDELTGPDVAAYHFVDLESRERWTLRPGRSRWPWWILSPSRRIPGTRPWDYARALRLAFAPRDATVGECVGTEGQLVRRFWDPMTVAVLNAGLEEGAAGLLWAVMRETFGRGEAACRPRTARLGLGDAFVDPALAFLLRNGADVQFRRRLKRIEFKGSAISTLQLSGDEAVAILPSQPVVLAVPPTVAGELVPDLGVPVGSRAIVNGHFLLPESPRGPKMIGLIGGVCQWVFVREDVASTTVSAAESLLDMDPESIAECLWPEVHTALGLGSKSLPPYRIIKEKRATFAQTPDNLRHRPPTRTRWSNLYLAGDWTATGLPATIEGSLRSGVCAAEALLGSA